MTAVSPRGFEFRRHSCRNGLGLGAPTVVVPVCTNDPSAPTDPMKPYVLVLVIGTGIGMLLPLPSPTLELQWLPPGSTPTLLRSPGAPCPQLSDEEQGLLDGPEPHGGDRTAPF